MTRKTLASVSLVSLLLWAAILSLVGWWWTVMLAWALLVLALVCWLYQRVKREEDAPRTGFRPTNVGYSAIPVHVITGAEQRELEREQSEFNAHPRSRIRLNTPEEWAAYEREVLNPEAPSVRDNAYLERARRAESLGFIDPDDAA